MSKKAEEMEVGKRLLAIVILGATFFGAGSWTGDVSAAWAHQTDQSTHTTEVRPATTTEESTEVEQLLSISLEDLNHHVGAESGADASEQIAAYLNVRTSVVGDETECELQEYEFIAYPGSDGRVHFRQLWDCPYHAATITLQNDVMHHTPGGYRHFGRVQVGEEIFATVFDPISPTYSVYISDPVEVAEEVGEEADEGPGRLLVIIGFGGILALFAIFGVAAQRSKAREIAKHPKSTCS